MKYDKKLALIILSIVLFFYFILPPYNKIAQIGYCINNIGLLFSVVATPSQDEKYVFHRNNAIYLARMHNEKTALKEINKAIHLYPSNAPEYKLQRLYRDKAEINLFLQNYREALNDFLRLESHNIVDKLKIAMLLKKLGKPAKAVSFCNDILEVDLKAYAGYACLADIYASVGKYEASVAIFDLLIDRAPKQKYYGDRAYYKKMTGDIDGANEDIQSAGINEVKKPTYPQSVIESKTLRLSIFD